MALEVPLGVILIWPGTNGTIPAGWKRTTALDASYPKGAAIGVGAGASGGSSTHTHTSPAHAHNPNPHRHFGQVIRDGLFETAGGNYGCSSDHHLHNFDYTNVGAGILSDAISYQAADSNPPFTEVIYIEPDTNPAAPPAGVVGLFARSTIPGGWILCDGNAGSPNFNNKYLRGAIAAGDGGNTGGSLNHQHAVDHTHTAVNHNHDGQTGQDSDQGANATKSAPAGGGPACDHHTHNVHLDNISEAGTLYTGFAGIADIVEPLNRKLLALKNNSGAPARPRFLVGIWLGSIASIPPGWRLMDGVNAPVDMQGNHLKITTDTTQIGAAGGSNTHVHAPSNSHTHLATSSHNHTGSTDVFPTSGNTVANADGVSQGHQHPSLTSCSSDTSTWNNATIQADASNGEPPYKTVLFIEFSGTPVNDQRAGETRGQIATSDQRAAELFGVTPAEDRKAEVWGKVFTAAERGAEVSGKIKWEIEPRTIITDYSA